MLGPGSLALAMYGAIAAGLALAIGVDAALTAAALVAAVLTELVVFFVAHAYVDVVGERYDNPDHSLRDRIVHGFTHASIVLLGGMPVVVIFGVEQLAGVNADDSATVAILGLIVVLGALGYVAARRGRASRRAALVESLVVALLGVGILTLKLLLK